MTDSPTRIALVTGASRGIGAETAKALAAAGRHVVCLSRNAERLDEVYRQIIEQGGEASVLACDVTDGPGLAQAVEQVFQDHHRLDILVNNAGQTRDNLLIRMSDEEFDEVLCTNLRSVFVTCRAALRPMMRARWGRIINVSSVAGVIGNAGQTNYAAAKSGVVGMTKSIAKEMASKNITANVVAPGFVDTAMTAELPQQVKQYAVATTPLHRFGQPEEIASAIAFLASDEASYITGQVLSVDGGLSMC